MALCDIRAGQGSGQGVCTQSHVQLSRVTSRLPRSSSCLGLDGWSRWPRVGGTAVCLGWLQVWQGWPRPGVLCRAVVSLQSASARCGGCVPGQAEKVASTGWWPSSGSAGHAWLASEECVGCRGAGFLRRRHLVQGWRAPLGGRGGGSDSLAQALQEGLGTHLCVALLEGQCCGTDIPEYPQDCL